MPVSGVPRHVDGGDAMTAGLTGQPASGQSVNYIMSVVTARERVRARAKRDVGIFNQGGEYIRNFKSSLRRARALCGGGEVVRG